jgi:hypothetical protein
MQLTAQLVKVTLQRRCVDGELSRQAEHIEVGLLGIRRGRILDMTLHMLPNTIRDEIYAVNEEPQPQDFLEFGLMKLNPCRINVSS